MPFLRKLPVALILAITASCNAASAILTPALDAQLAAVVGQFPMPGYAFAVVHPDGDVEYRTFGNRTEDGLPYQADTLMTMGSTSKAFTAAAVGLLMDDFAHGRNKVPLPHGVKSFDWNTPMRELLPEEWKLLNHTASHEATMADLLSHSSGLPRHDFAYTKNDTAQALVERMRYLRPNYPFRQGWLYTNLHYILATNVIEQYSGQNFTTFVEERIFTPLGMNSSTYLPSQAAASGKFSQSWSPIGPRRIPNWFDDSDYAIAAGPGGVISTLTDMTKWVSLVMGHSNNTAATKAIPRAVLDACLTPHVPIPITPLTPASIPGATNISYGFGWWQMNFFGHKLIQHDGSIAGVATNVAFLPEQGVGLVQFANAHGVDKVNFLVTAMIAQAVLNVTTPATSTGSQPSASASQASKSQTTQSLPSPTPVQRPALEAFAGTYSNPGYIGSMTICAPSSTSIFCKEAYSNISITEPAAFANGTETLFSAYERAWSSHIIFPRNLATAANFTFTPVVAYPAGYGTNTTPFAMQLQQSGNTQFAFDKKGKVTGFGLFALEGVFVPRPGMTVEKTADVWFAKHQ